MKSLILAVYADENNANGKTTYPLHDGENVIGSANSCNIRLNFPQISEEHVKIIISDGEISIEDMGGPYGVFR